MATIVVSLVPARIMRLLLSRRNLGGNLRRTCRLARSCTSPSKSALTPAGLSHPRVSPLRGSPICCQSLPRAVSVAPPTGSGALRSTCLDRLRLLSRAAPRRPSATYAVEHRSAPADIPTAPPAAPLRRPRPAPLPLPTPSCCASQAAATSLSRCSSTALTPRRPRSPRRCAPLSAAPASRSPGPSCANACASTTLVSVSPSKLSNNAASPSAAPTAGTCRHDPHPRLPTRSHPAAVPLFHRSAPGTRSERNDHRHTPRHLSCNQPRPGARNATPSSARASSEGSGGRRDPDPVVRRQTKPTAADSCGHPSPNRTDWAAKRRPAGNLRPRPNRPRPPWRGNACAGPHGRGPRTDDASVV